MSGERLPPPEAVRTVANPTFLHGLVVGKFYPPHAGHDFLVRSAAAFCRRVTVLVLGSSVESLPIATRVGWIRETHARRGNVRVGGALDDVRIDYDDAAVWDAHVAVFLKALEELDRANPAGAVDAVFSSEAYGAELARRLGATDVRLDQARSLVPLSGTAVRADPAGRFEDVAPAVRAGLARRVVVLGAESTGTTTLAVELAAALRARGGPLSRTLYVAEYGREYSQAKLAAARAAAAATGSPAPELADLLWQSAEFELIVREQLAWEEGAARLGGPVLVCDTDPFATLVWHERYVGQPPPSLGALATLAAPRALYLLTTHEGVPFEDDGLRDGERVRAAMTGRLRAALRVAGAPTVEVAGDRAERLARALEAVDAVLADWTFAPPLG